MADDVFEIKLFCASRFAPPSMTNMIYRGSIWTRAISTVELLTETFQLSPQFHPCSTNIDLLSFTTIIYGDELRHKRGDSSNTQFSRCIVGSLINIVKSLFPSFVGPRDVPDSSTLEWASMLRLRQESLTELAEELYNHLRGGGEQSLKLAPNTIMELEDIE